MRSVGKEFRNGKQNGRREGKGRVEKLTVKVVWKNVRKIRTREKQIELEEWMIVMYVL